MSALPMHPAEHDRERFRDAARQHLTWCDFNRTGIDGDYKDAETRYLFKMWWSVERERQLLQNLNMSQGGKLSELAQKLEKAEDVLRSLSSFVGAGGYNADKVDADMFEQKIRWGIGQIMERLEIAEAELAKMRAEPAVPAPSVPEEWRTDDPQVGELILVKRNGHYLPFVGEFRATPYRSCINRGTGKWVGFSEWVSLSSLMPSADHSEESLEMVTPELRNSAKDQGICDHD